jgi:hypothetical protein
LAASYRAHLLSLESEMDSLREVANASKEVLKVSHRGCQTAAESSNYILLHSSQKKQKKGQVIHNCIVILIQWLSPMNYYLPISKKTKKNNAYPEESRDPVTSQSRLLIICRTQVSRCGNTFAFVNAILLSNYTMQFQCL